MARRSPTPTHPFWGVFAATTDLPNVLGASTQSANLEVGDQAYVSAASGMFVCTDATQGAAAWVAMGSGGGGGAPSPVFGELLWQWNGVDTSQFESTAFAYERDIGTPTPNAATALALGITSAPSPKLGSALQIVATNLAGGGVFAILESELTLPERYVVYWKTLAGSGVQNLLHLAFVPDDGLGDFQGFGSERTGGTSSAVLRTIQGNRVSNVSQTLATSGNNSSSFSDPRGGVEQIIQVWRPNGDNPSEGFARVEDRGGQNLSVNFTGVNIGALSGVQPNWNGLDLNRIGVGCWESNNGTSGSVALLDLRVYAFPD